MVALNPESVNGSLSISKSDLGCPFSGAEISIVH